mmetsp:Transcript_7234/g.16323  ORF Transcript_7234/g.16323 Transcript_7234/m.16323 type:complete len:645 (-) Transcript_7234:2235-4169(-)
MMISKSRCRWVGVFVRISGGKTIKGTTAAIRSKNIQRDFFSATAALSTSSFVSSKIGPMFVDHGPKNSVPKTLPVVVDLSGGHCCLPFYSSSSSSSLSLQKRFRSALPEDFYEEEEDEHDDPKEAPAINTAEAAAATARTGTGTGTAPTPFLMADIGEGIAEVELLRWFVREGQTICEFDPVCEVQSDKATVEITSRYEGTVHKLAYQASGSMIQVGEPILWIQEPNTNSEDHHHRDQQDRHQQMEENRELADDPVVATNPNNSSMKSTTEVSSTRDTTDVSTSVTSETWLTTLPKPQSGSSGLGTVGGQQEKNTDASLSVPTVTSEKILTSPAVRKLARDHALDLSTVTGTGPSGRITKGDILTIVKESAGDRHPSTTVTATAPAIEVESQFNCSLREDTVVPLRGYNRIMAETMTASLKIPHMVYSDEINLNRFLRYKMEHQQHTEQKKLVFLPLAIKAASKALEKYPWLNASFDEEKQEATLWKDHNIGIAMDTPRGLIVPVLKHCQDKTLPEIAQELKRLKDSVTCQEGGGLPASDLQGATFTLSNVGAIGGGGTYMSPIITPPQVAIGAMGKIQRLPRFVAAPSCSKDPTPSQRVEEAHICAVSWAADHRVVDGATVARFHKSWKEYMEDPIRLLLELR